MEKETLASLSSRETTVEWKHDYFGRNLTEAPGLSSRETTVEWKLTPCSTAGPT